MIGITLRSSQVQTLNKLTLEDFLIMQNSNNASEPLTFGRVFWNCRRNLRLSQRELATQLAIFGQIDYIVQLSLF